LDLDLAVNTQPDEVLAVDEALARGAGREDAHAAEL